jgi:hypothetical protein
MGSTDWTVVSSVESCMIKLPRGWLERPTWPSIGDLTVQKSRFSAYTSRLALAAFTAASACSCWAKLATGLEKHWASSTSLCRTIDTETDADFVLCNELKPCGRFNASVTSTDALRSPWTMPSLLDAA